MLDNKTDEFIKTLLKTRLLNKSAPLSFIEGLLNLMFST